MYKDIQDFHRRYDLSYEGQPRQLPKELAAFRIKFLKEELREYEKAVAEKDLEGQFDALIDLVYVAIGTSYLQGFPWAAGWYEVHKANMKKVRVTTQKDSKRGSTYDVVKPSGWKKPNIKRLLGLGT